MKSLYPYAVLISFFATMIMLINIYEYVKAKIKKQAEIESPRKKWLSAISQYPWTALVTLVSAIVIWTSSYYFMDFVGRFDIDLLPECTAYCYVEIDEDGITSVFPCKVEKIYADERGASYVLDSLMVNDDWIDFSDEEIELEPEKKVSASWEDNENYYSCKMKLCNRKYAEPDGISQTSKMTRIIEDLLMIFCDLLYTLTAVSRGVELLKKYPQTSEGD